MPSFLDHTPVGLAHHSERQARRRRHPRAHQRSDNGIRHFHRKYVEFRKYPHGKGVLISKIVGRGFISRRLYSIRSRKRRQQATALQKRQKGNIIPKNRFDIAFYLFLHNGFSIGSWSHSRIFLEERIKMVFVVEIHYLTDMTQG